MLVSCVLGGSRKCFIKVGNRFKVKQESLKIYVSKAEFRKHPVELFRTFETPNGTHVRVKVSFHIFFDTVENFVAKIDEI